ncbi:helix-turn-helix transcriptional regulator [Agrobacterium tumefaciens]|uniref:helix-turn-helix transcriptional regulator n=1 Tax=Agrobacterium tumefaciens TaxID=358 RepID=UPI0021D0CC0C|nr:AraC family transcriptional regulator [Agrobacterium tumefaciens]UXS00514.1 AraC family transcriptional regulator [Agrobacterium tumefaciens]
MGSRQFVMPKTSMPGVAAVIADSDRSFPRHMHDQFGIGLVERGAQKSQSGRGQVEAQAGNLITVNPGEVHDGIPLGQGGRAWTMLYLDPEVVHAAVSDIEEKQNGGFEFVHPVDVRPLANRFRLLFAAMTARDDAMRCEETLLTLMSAVFEKPRPLSVRAAPEAMNRAREMIDDSPERQFLLADLAGEAGMSRFRFLRSFAHVTGLTPHNYLLQRRVQAARRLLAQGMAPAEAALTSGFSDQSHLNRVFVRYFGVTPSAYRAALS